jgi:hypothetical protein
LIRVDADTISNPSFKAANIILNYIEAGGRVIYNFPIVTLPTLAISLIPFI